MAHFKRKKSKRIVRCTLCTPSKWKGNHRGRHDHQTDRRKAAAEQEIKETLVNS